MTPIQDSQCFQVNKEFQVEKFDNEILLYSISTNKGVYLNETAYLVWTLCGKGYTKEEIISIISRAYPDNKNEIPQDVSSAIESLSADNVLIVDNE